MLPQMRSRRIAAIIAGLGFIIFLSSFIASFWWDVDYVVRLALWFGAMLALFHLHYALSRKLTSRRVKKIDYWYLGATVLGVFLFAGAFADQRNLLIYRSSERIEELRESENRAIFAEKAQKYLDVSCIPETDSNLQKHCERAQKFIALLKTSPAPNAMVEVAVELEKYLDAERRGALIWQRQNRDITDKDIEGLRRLEAAHSAARVLDDRILNYAFFDQRAKPQTPPDPRLNDDFYHNFLALGHALLWPFLLTFAFALRLTKVTIEVFSWNDDDARQSK